MYKTRTILIKFGKLYSFLNKFIATSCKRLPPHVNNVSTLHCKT